MTKDRDKDNIEIQKRYNNNGFDDQLSTMKYNTTTSISNTNTPLHNTNNNNVIMYCYNDDDKDNNNNNDDDIYHSQKQNENKQEGQNENNEKENKERNDNDNLEISLSVVSKTVPTKKKNENTKDKKFLSKVENGAKPVPVKGKEENKRESSIFTSKATMDTDTPQGNPSNSNSSTSGGVNTNSNTNTVGGGRYNGNGNSNSSGRNNENNGVMRERSLARDNRGGGSRNRYTIGGQSKSNRSVGDDYMTVVSDMIYPKVSFGDYASQGNADEAEFPLERPNTLGILLCGARRPTTFEKWNPYEIALFEGAISIYGKEFHEIAKIIKTKNCKECIEFYYVWKKTYHYTAWKNSFERTNKMEDDNMETEIASVGGTNSHQLEMNSNTVNGDGVIMESSNRNDHIN